METSIPLRLIVSKASLICFLNCLFLIHLIAAPLLPLPLADIILDIFRTPYVRFSTIYILFKFCITTLIVVCPLQRSTTTPQVGTTGLQCSVAKGKVLVLFASGAAECPTERRLLKPCHSRLLTFLVFYFQNRF